MTITDEERLLKKKHDHHVIYCATAVHAVKGSRAEKRTVNFLLKHLDTRVVGDYRLLVNYHIVEREQDRKAGNALEVDVLVINRRGVFLLEVKDWTGLIKPHDNVWAFQALNRRNEEPRDNAYHLITSKATVLYSQLFGKNGSFSELGSASVSGLIVLTQGRSTYRADPNCHDNLNYILDLSTPLIEGLSTQRLLHRGDRSAPLTDVQIEKISQRLYDVHKPVEVVVHGYRIDHELSQGDLFSVAFAAQHTRMPERWVRLKRYELLTQDEERQESDLRKFQQSIRALSALEEDQANIHILRTRDFLEDDLHQPGVFYEITELPSGPDLAQVMENHSQRDKPMPLKRQLAFVEAVGTALKFAHNHKNQRGGDAAIYHRNICPETVFQMRDRTIKLGDFDFAKIVGAETIFEPGESGPEKPFTAPELQKTPSLATRASDIYALGVLWFFMAALPQEPAHFKQASIKTLALPPEAMKLMTWMTEPKAADRPGRIEEVLERLEAIKAQMAGKVEQENEAEK